MVNVLMFQAIDPLIVHIDKFYDTQNNENEYQLCRKHRYKHRV